MCSIDVGLLHIASGYQRFDLETFRIIIGTPLTLGTCHVTYFGDMIDIRYAFFYVSWISRQVIHGFILHS